MEVNTSTRKNMIPNGLHTWNPKVIVFYASGMGML